MPPSFDIDAAEQGQRARRPSLYESSVSFSESRVGVSGIAKTAASRIVSYLQRAMAAVAQRYLDESFAAANRVQQYLTPALAAAGYRTLTFEHQGSATNGTIIREHSDVDLLAVTGHVSAIEIDGGRAQVAPNYRSELLLLRGKIKSSLVAALRSESVDPYPDSKAVTIPAGVLTRKVDVVPAGWLQTLEFARTKDAVRRGIGIADPRKSDVLFNWPFLHNQLIEQKDARSGGNYRPLVRMLKNIVADARIEGVSSYDATALVYWIPDAVLRSLPQDAVALLDALRAHLDDLSADSARRSDLLVPVGNRRLFVGSGGGTLTMPAVDNLKAQVAAVAAAAARRS